MSVCYAPIHYLSMTMKTSVETPSGRVERTAMLLAGVVLSLVLGHRESRAAYLSDMVELHFAEAASSPARLLSAPTWIAAAGDPIGPEGPTRRECPELLRQTFTRLQGGNSQSLCEFSGKVLLVVNTASYCGYTRQYEGLEALYRKYKGRGLVVLGFPSNDFNQEPGSNQQVAEFCRTTYGVQFPMFEKQSVTRLSANPFYAELTRRTGKAPKWNFHKYVIDRSGTEVVSFGSATEPDQKDLLLLIERLLETSAPRPTS